MAPALGRTQGDGKRRRVARWFLLCVLAGFGLVACRTGGAPSTPPPAARAVDPGVGPGDELEIRVADHDDMSGPYQVGSDGAVDFPYVGAVEVTGLSPHEVARKLEAALADGYLREPQVTVRVLARQNREVSILGEVEEPGSYPYKERLTLVQAVSVAGGLTPVAMPRKVKLIRETGGGRTTFEIDLRAILDGKREDLPLEPGDIVVVPESPI